MDNKNHTYTNPPDVDVPPSAPPSYEVSANYHHQDQQQQSASFASSSHQVHHSGNNSSMIMPSAPPSIPPTPPFSNQQHHHFSYGSMYPQPIYSYQNAQYQHQLQQQQQQQQQSYEESPQQYRYIISNRDRGDRHFPVNAALFVLGWLFPPLWFIGCCWKSQNVYENAWRKANVFMTVVSLLVFTLFTVFLTLLMLEERDNLPPANPGDLPNLPPTMSILKLKGYLSFVH